MGYRDRYGNFHYGRNTAADKRVADTERRARERIEELRTKHERPVGLSRSSEGEDE